MLDYETFCRIHHLHEHHALTIAQIARALSLDARTVATWLAETHYRPRRSSRRASKLDPYKRLMRQLIETHPYSAVQILQRLREARYEGGITIVKDYLRTVRRAAHRLSSPSPSPRANAPKSTGGNGARCAWATPGASSPSSSWCCAIRG